MRLDDLRTLTEVLAERSFTLPEIWEENRWVAHLVPLPLIGKATAAGNAVPRRLWCATEPGTNSMCMC